MQFKSWSDVTFTDVTLTIVNKLFAKDGSSTLERFFILFFGFQFAFFRPQQAQKVLSKGFLSDYEIWTILVRWNSGYSECYFQVLKSTRCVRNSVCVSVRQRVSKPIAEHSMGVIKAWPLCSSQSMKGHKVWLKPKALWAYKQARWMTCCCGIFCSRFHPILSPLKIILEMIFWTNLMLDLFLYLIRENQKIL